MKPEQFIREYGVEKAREVVSDAPNGATLFRLGGIEEIPTYLKMIDGKYWRYSWRKGFMEGCQVTYNKINDDGELVSLSDLKHLLESLDLVNCFDDLEQAKSWVSDMDEDFPYMFKGDTYDNRFYKHELVTAIADHESIYGGGDE